MKHSELRHQPRHVNPRIQVASDGVTIVIAVTIAAVIMNLFFINTVPPFFILYI